jgi:hypothetical protein
VLFDVVEAVDEELLLPEDAWLEVLSFRRLMMLFRQLLAELLQFEFELQYVLGVQLFFEQSQASLLLQHAEEGA